MILSCQGISKSFGEKVILEDASFHIEEREKAAREFDSCIIKIVRAGRIKPVLFLSSFSLYYLVIFSDM